MLIIRVITFELVQPIWPWYLNVTDPQFFRGFQIFCRSQSATPLPTSLLVMPILRAKYTKDFQFDGQTTYDSNTAQALSTSRSKNFTIY